MLSRSLILAVLAATQGRVAQQSAYTHNVDTSRYGERLICVVPMRDRG